MCVSENKVCVPEHMGESIWDVQRWPSYSSRQSLFPNLVINIIVGDFERQSIFSPCGPVIIINRAHWAEINGQCSFYVF